MSSESHHVFMLSVAKFSISNPILHFDKPFLSGGRCQGEAIDDQKVENYIDSKETPCLFSIFFTKYTRIRDSHDL